MKYHRWIAVSVIDIVTEVALASIAIRIIWSLQIRPSKKLGVAFAFLQRLAIIAPIAARLHYLSIVYKSDDPTLHAAYSTICKQTQVAFAMVAASVPCLRPFLTATATHYGAPAEGAKSSHGQYANTAGSSKMHPDHGVGAFSLKKLNLGKKGESSQSSKTDRRSRRPKDRHPQDRDRPQDRPVSATYFNATRGFTSQEHGRRA